MKKGIIGGVMALALALVLVASSVLAGSAPTSTPTAAPTPAPEEEGFTVLNPQSWVAPFEAVPLNPRLDTLEGKTIGIEGEGRLHLAAPLKAAVPGIKDIIMLTGNYSRRSATGESAMRKSTEEAVKELGIDAVVTGIAH